MALIKCQECGNEVSTTAKTCPKCGAKVVGAETTTVPKPPPQLTLIHYFSLCLIGLVGFVFLIGKLTYVSPEEKEKSPEAIAAKQREAAVIEKLKAKAKEGRTEESCGTDPRSKGSRGKSEGEG